MKRIEFSLNKEVNDDKTLKYEDIYNIDECANIIDLVNNILISIEYSVPLEEFNLTTQIAKGLSYTKHSIKVKNIIKIIQFSK